MLGEVHGTNHVYARGHFSFFCMASAATRSLATTFCIAYSILSVS